MSSDTPFLDGLLTYDPQARGVRCPKPEKQRTTKGRQDRAEAKVTRAVRAFCVARDGDCRAKGLPPCGGESEWAHLHTHRRSKTRGLAPEQRHTTAGSLMLCTRHHALYDAHELQIAVLTVHGADGPLEIG